MIIITDDCCIVLVSNMTGKTETSDEFMWVALQMTIQNYYKCVIKYASTFMKKCYTREIKNTFLWETAIKCDVRVHRN